MKVVCLEKLRRMRSPYERTPFVPRTSRRYIDELPWDLRFPIQPGRPWTLIGTQVPVKEVSAANSSVALGNQTVANEVLAAKADVTQRAPPAPSRELSASPAPSRELLASPAPSRELSTSPAPIRELSVEEAAPALGRTRTRVRFSEPPFSEAAPSWHVAGSSASSQVDRPSRKGTQAQRSTVAPLPHESLPQKSLPHKLKKRDTTMHCFRTEGSAMKTPPKLHVAAAYDVYLHQSDGNNHVWYASERGDWIPTSFGDCHPLYPEYTLFFSNDNWARWLLKKTVSTYNGRKDREQQSKPRAGTVG